MLTSLKWIVLLPIFFVLCFTFFGLFRANKKQPLRSYFVAFNGWTLIWLISNFLFLLFDRDFLWFKMTYMFGAFMIPAALLLIYGFSSQKSLAKKVIWMTYAVGGIFAFASIFDNIFFMGDTETYSPLFLFYLVFMLFFVVFSLFQLVVSIKKFDGIKKVQATYILTGFILFACVEFSLSFLCPFLGHAELGRLDVFGVPFFIGFTGYAIIKHHLMDIDLLQRKAGNQLLYVIVVSIVLCIPAYFLRGLPWFLSTGWFVIIAVLVSPHLYEWITGHTETMLLGKKFGYLKKLDELAHSTGVVRSLSEEVNTLITKLFEIMQLENISFFILRERDKCFKQYAQINRENGENESIATPPMPINNSLVHFLSSTKKPLVKESLREDTSYDASTRDGIIHIMNSIIAEIAFPLFIEDKLIGILFIGRKEQDALFHEEDMKKLDHIVAIAEHHLAQVFFMEDLSVSLQDKYQRHLLDTAKRMITLKKLDDLLPHIARILLRSANASYVGIYVPDADHAHYVRKYEKGTLEGTSATDVIDAEHVFVRFLRSREEPVLYTHLLQLALQSKWDDMKQIAEGAKKLQATVVLPIILDELLGFIVVGNRRGGGDYEQREWNTFNLVTYSAAMAIQNVVFSENVSKDSLTRLFNHGYFDTRTNEGIIQTIRNNEPMSILSIDIDFFKKYNDEFGHQQGDIILKHFGDYLKESVRPSDVVCRPGGEEFTVLLPGTDQKGAVVLAERLREGLLKQRILRAITISIGVGTYIPSKHERNHAKYDIESIREQLKKRADVAVYKAKTGGRNRVCVSEELKEQDEVIGKKIVLIGNDADMAETYTHYFHIKAYEIECVPIHHAEELKNKRTGDVIIVDMDTLGIDSAEAVKAVCRMHELTPVGVISEHGEKKQEMIDIGVKRFFLKPTDKKDIEEWIERI